MGAALVCRPLFVPEEFLPHVSTLLQTLTDVWRWEAYGTYTPEECAALMTAMLSGYFDGGCHVDERQMTGYVPIWPVYNSSGGWNFLPNSSSFNGGLYTYVTPAVGAFIEFQLSMLPGMYYINILHARANAGGQISVMMDGEEILAYDAYRSTSLYNIVEQTDEFVLDGSTTAILRFEVTGKNASSSNYHAYLHEVVWTRAP